MPVGQLGSGFEERMKKNSNAADAPPATASSDALVLFGGTGDLARKKIYPALLAMVERGHLSTR